MDYNRIDVNNVFSVDKIVTVYSIEVVKNQGESHDFWELLYLDKGALTILLDGIPHQLSEGEAIFYAPNVYHSGVESNIGHKVDIISFECRSPSMEQFRGKIVLLNSEAKKQLAEIIAEGTRHLEGYGKGMRLKSDAPEYLLQSIKNRLELLLINMAFQNQTTPSRSSNIENRYKGISGQIFAYLSARVTERVTIEQICAEFAISASQAKKIFREEFGCGMIELFNSLKINAAKRLISESSLSFGEISEYLGFSSVYYFSKLFKSKTGTTPSQYSKSIGLLR